MNPLFSIIIPLYNKEKYIQKTLESVFAQSFSDYEIIIVNDGSTDESEAVVKRFDDQRLCYFKKENGGVSSARNMGISLAKGKYIAFLDADDYWYPYFLEEIHKYMLLFPGQKVFSTAIEFEHNGKVSKATYSVKKTGEYEIVNYFDTTFHKAILFTSAYLFEILFTSASIFQKEVFTEVGIFDTSIKSGEDTDQWIRVGLKYKVCFIWKVCVRYTHDPKSLSRNISSVTDKSKYSKYLDLEKENKVLKNYIDNKRFSLAIKSKFLGDRESFHYFFSQIDLKNLSYKKRFLLFLPEMIVRPLACLKDRLIRLSMIHSSNS